MGDRKSQKKKDWQMDDSADHSKMPKRHQAISNHHTDSTMTQLSLNWVILHDADVIGIK